MTAPSMPGTPGLERLPRIGGCWKGALRLQPDGQVRLAWVDVDAGEVRACCDLSSLPGPEDVWTALTQAMANPLEGRPCCPASATWPEITVLQLLQERARGLGIFFQSPTDTDCVSVSYEGITDSAAVARFAETAARLAKERTFSSFEGDDLRVQGLAAEPVRIRTGRYYRAEAAVSVLPSEPMEEPLASLEFVSSSKVGPLLLTEFQRNGWPLHRGEYRRDCSDEVEDKTVTHYVEVPLASTAWPLSRAEGLEGLRLLTRAMQLLEILPHHPEELRDAPFRMADGSEVRVTWRSTSVLIREEEEARKLDDLESDLRLLKWDARRSASRIALAAGGLATKDRRLALIERSLGLDPDCVDGWLRLALDNGEPQERIRLFRQAAEAGLRADMQDAGNRLVALAAVKHLVLELWNSGDWPTAVDEAQTTLAAHPKDELGLRPLLSQMLLASERFDRAEELLEGAPERSTWWHYDRTLLEFRRNGDTTEARERLHQAQLANPHVLRELGDSFWRQHWTPPPSPLPGSPKEAEHYAYLAMRNWGRGDGPVLTWAAKVPVRRTPLRPERPNAHQACWCGSRFKYRDCHMSADDSLAKVRLS